MNIVVDARLILDQVTGIGHYLRNLIQHLLVIDKRNRYTLFLNQKLSSENPLRSLNQRNLTKKFLTVPAVSLRQHFQIPLHLRNGIADVYHYPHFDLPLLQWSKSVMTVHDLKYIIAPHFTELGLAKQLYMKLLLKRSLMKAKIIISVSENTKKDLIRVFRVPENKISVVPLACDIRPTEKMSREEIKSYLRKQGILESYFLFVGERRPHKNLVRLIEAFNLFRNRNACKHKLVIVGKNYSSYAQPEKRIKELHLQDQVIVSGYVDENHLPFYYQGAEAFIFPSLYEGFGLPILEAMSYGTPVITSRVSAMPEVAGDAAIQINPHSVDQLADALETLYRRKQTRTELIAKGYRNLNRFSWRKTSEKTLSVYEQAYSQK